MMRKSRSCEYSARSRKSQRNTEENIGVVVTGGGNGKQEECCLQSSRNPRPDDSGIIPLYDVSQAQPHQREPKMAIGAI